MSFANLSTCGWIAFVCGLTVWLHDITEAARWVRSGTGTCPPHFFLTTAVFAAIVLAGMQP